MAARRTALRSWPCWQRAASRSCCPPRADGSNTRVRRGSPPRRSSAGRDPGVGGAPSVSSRLMPAPARNLVNLKDVDKGFGSRSVLRGITLGIVDGDRIGVVGRNGDGKSTLLRLIAEV